jgi:hypothetical protein
MANELSSPTNNLSHQDNLENNLLPSKLNETKLNYYLMVCIVERKMHDA